MNANINLANKNHGRLMLNISQELHIYGIQTSWLLGITTTTTILQPFYLGLHRGAGSRRNIDPLSQYSYN